MTSSSPTTAVFLRKLTNPLLNLQTWIQQLHSAGKGDGRLKDRKTACSRYVCRILKLLSLCVFRTHSADEDTLSVLFQDKRQKQEAMSTEEDIFLSHKMLVRHISKIFFFKLKCTENDRCFWNSLCSGQSGANRPIGYFARLGTKWAESPPHRQGPCVRRHTGPVWYCR